MKKLFIILFCVVVIQDGIAQNILNKIGLSTTATGAFSLRLLSSSYAGFSIQVRRSSDNATQDIGFTVNGDLDSASLKIFTASNNAYITKWYDQGGSGYDATQPTAGNQPVIVTAGVIGRRNKVPRISFTGSQWLSLPINFVRATYPGATVNTVYQLTSQTGSQALWGCDDGGWDRLQLLNFDASPSFAYGMSNGGGTVPNATNNTNTNVYTAIMDYGVSNGSYVAVNGVMGSSFTESGSGSTANLAIGAIGSGGGFPFIGNMGEFILFASAVSPSVRQTMEDNQKIYYNIGLPDISVQPGTANQTLCLGGIATQLSVMATGTGALTYQWYSNTIAANTGGTLINGATGNSFIPPVTSVGTAYYYVEVTDSTGGMMTSDVSGAITIPVQLNAAVNTVNPTCLLPGTITISNPISESNTFINSDFSSVPANATLTGSAVISGGECILTPALSGQEGILSFALPAAPAVFTAVFDYRVADGSGADGTSFNYGVLTTGGLYEYGIVSSGLVVRMIEYQAQRVEVSYNGTTLISVGFNLVNTSYRTCIITITGANQLTMSIGGTNIISNLALPAGYATADKSSWQFAFASRCGGSSNKHSIKNLSIAGSLLQYSIDGSTWQAGTSFSVPGGTYTVKMQLVNSSVCNLRDIATVSLVAPIGPVAGVTGTTSGYDSVTLTASGGVSYSWTGGTSLNTAANTFTRSGTYKVMVADGNGCRDSVTSTVTIYLLGLTKYGGITTDSLLQLDKTGAIATATKVDRYGKTRSSSGPDGGIAARAGSSAYQIKQDFPASADGIYWIQNININGGTPFRIYADMTTDGGGWTLIMCNASPNPGWTNAQALLRNEISPGISSTYSIIGWADYIKKSSIGFQYMMDAQTRRTNGGIWTANSNYSFVSTSNANTNITLNIKFGTWNYSDGDIEARMPWYAPGSQGIVTTSADANGNWWGTLIAAGGWTPAPWLGSSTANPGTIWYWVR